VVVLHSSALCELCSSSAGSSGEAVALCWSTGGAASAGRRDGSGSEEAGLCRGERRGELSGHVERVGVGRARRMRRVDAWKKHGKEALAW